MFMRPMMMGLAAAVSSALKWAEAGTYWTISSDGLNATRAGAAGTTLVRTAIARTTGPAAFSVTVNARTSQANGTVIGLYPPGAALSSPANTNRVTWRSDGVVNINGTDASTDASPYVAGDVLTFRLSAAGTSITLLKNGVVAGTYTITATSRVPSAVANTLGPNLTINGAPAGETPWG